ncbi:MAG: hypothetical protein NVV73_00300 [Cellvibrionaceae bacterium]|nr:hypothetical protein [Cellvibrionaceae bacterium]
MSLSLTDLSLLIPLVKQELGVLQGLANGQDVQLAEDATELLMLYRQTAAKLKEEYETQWWDGSDFPAYDTLIREL